MRSLIFDTETTGLYDRKKPLSDPSQPDVIQLAYILYDDDADLVWAHQEILIFTEMDIHPKAFEAHGITKKELELFGVTRRVATAMFNNVLKQCDQLVAHNLEFDVAQMTIAYLKEGFGADQFNQKRHFCTKERSTDVCRLPNPKFPGKFKWPTMSEAYCHLVDPAGFDGAHHAMADARACLAVYKELKNRLRKAA